MDNKIFKENIKKYYDAEAELRNSKSVRPDWKVKVREDFCGLMKQERKESLLEIGSGAGYDSRYFMDCCFSVTAADISPEMVKICREKSIEAYELDYYCLSSLKKSFDCVYALNTLLHVPKNDLRQVLSEIHSVINAGGLFYMGVYGGDDTENEFVKIEVSEAPRHFTFYSESFLRTVFTDFFEIIKFDTLKINPDGEIFHSIILRKK